MARSTLRGDRRIPDDGPATAIPSRGHVVGFDEAEHRAVIEVVRPSEQRSHRLRRQTSASRRVDQTPSPFQAVISVEADDADAGVAEDRSRCSIDNWLLGVLHQVGHLDHVIEPGIGRLGIQAGPEHHEPFVGEQLDEPVPVCLDRAA